MQKLLPQHDVVKGGIVYIIVTNAIIGAVPKIPMSKLLVTLKSNVMTNQFEWLF